MRSKRVYRVKRVDPKRMGKNISYYTNIRGSVCSVESLSIGRNGVLEIGDTDSEDRHKYHTSTVRNIVVNSDEEIIFETAHATYTLAPNKEDTE